MSECKSHFRQAITADLVQLDDNLQEWRFQNFSEGLRETKHNSKIFDTPERVLKRNNPYHSKE